MRKLARLPLSAGALRFLAQNRTKKVRQAADAAAEAKRLWSMQDNRAFREIRQLLRTMAPGIEHCMYCESNEGTDIEHFWPKATYPLKAYEWPNYLLACSNCNSNYKRGFFPLNAAGDPLLIDPTAEDPREHLEFLPLTGKYRGTTPKGAHSIDVFGLKRETLERSRRNAWIALQSLLIQYSDCRAENDDARASDIQRVVCEHPFASLLVRMLDLAQEPVAPTFLSARCIQAIHQHAEFVTWL